MEDVITDFPPPSRLFFDDLNNFSSLPQPLPSPFLLLSNPNPNAEPSSPLEPSLLIVAVSRPSTFLLHHLRGRSLVGTLVLPEFSVAANSLDSSSLDNNSAHLYALDTAPGVLLALIQYQIPSERSSAVAKVVFEKIRPKKVLVLSSIQSMNFRVHGASQTHKGVGGVGRVVVCVISVRLLGGKLGKHYRNNTDTLEKEILGNYYTL